MVDPPLSEAKRSEGCFLSSNMMATRGVTMLMEIAWVEELGNFDIVFAV